MDIQSFLERLQKVRPNKDGWTALCPGHEDKSPSLSIGVGTDGRILLHCHAGCPAEQVVAYLGKHPAAFVERFHDFGATSGWATP